MKTLITLATLVFLAAIGGVNLMAAGQATKPPAASSAAAPAVQAPAQPAGQAAAPAPAAPAPAPTRYTLAEIARHADAKSCWMAIDGVVYDFTAYLPQHPADPQAMLKHCGREASEAFRTKDAGRPHSPYAARLLGTYRIGTLRD
ncbi:MAG: cytochrome b5 domain-containing protein [Gammaproteobacteria bacterium]